MAQIDPKAHSRLAYIDVLRGAAILLVFVHHLPWELGQVFGSVHEWGGRGVDLFFVLSGYLIGTTCLARAARFPDVGSGAQARAYWLLRILRIFPLYFGVLGLFAIGAPWLGPTATYVIRNYPGWYLTFTSNYLPQGSFELGILWSLAIEEQFYLVIGLLILAHAQNEERLRVSFATISIVTLLTSIAARFSLLELKRWGALGDAEHAFRLFHGTVERLDSLGYGLMGAVVAPRFNAWLVRRSVRVSRLGVWVSIALALALITHLPHRRVVGFSILGIGCFLAIMVAQAARPEPTEAAALRIPLALERAVLRVIGLIGKLSFGLYVFHPIVRAWILGEADRLPFAEGDWRLSVLVLGAWIGVTTLIAYVSYRFLEEPLLVWARKRAEGILARAKAARAESVQLGSDAA